MKANENKTDSEVFNTTPVYNFDKLMPSKAVAKQLIKLLSDYAGVKESKKPIKISLAKVPKTTKSKSKTVSISSGLNKPAIFDPEIKAPEIVTPSTSNFNKNDLASDDDAIPDNDENIDTANEEDSFDPLNMHNIHEAVQRIDIKSSKLTPINDKIINATKFVSIFDVAGRRDKN
jgi:hypothetical protein